MKLDRWFRTIAAAAVIGLPCLPLGASVPVEPLSLAAAVSGTAADSSASPADEPEFAIPTTVDRAGRIVAEVHIGPHGPFRFVLDTGANRSAISQRTAALIGLVPTHSSIVHGITGFAVMPQVQVEKFRIGELRFADRRFAILPDAVFGSADGIIGVDTLQTARVDIDFVKDRVVVRKSSRSSPEDRVVIRATVRHHGLLLISARIGRVPIKAIIDTGAERSLGNSKLLSALYGRSESRQNPVTTTVVGATAQVATGQSFHVPSIDLRVTRIGNLLVTFGDFHVFKVWSLLDEPALVIGMDVLGTLPEFSIDYPRREFQLKVDHRLPPVSSPVKPSP